MSSDQQAHRCDIALQKIIAALQHFMQERGSEAMQLLSASKSLSQKRIVLAYQHAHASTGRQQATYVLDGSGIAVITESVDANDISRKYERRNPASIGYIARGVQDHTNYDAADLIAHIIKSLEAIA